MKVINNTCWQTKHLRAIVGKVAQEELDTPKRKQVKVTFVPARQQNYVTGRAIVGGYSCTIHIPTKKDPDKGQLAAVIAHELAHLRGAKGERWMRAAGCRYSNRGDAYKRIYAWAYTLPLERKIPITKPTRGSEQHIQKQIAKMENAIKQWQRREKMAKTKLRKYKQKLKYFQGRLS